MNELYEFRCVRLDQYTVGTHPSEMNGFTRRADSLKDALLSMSCLFPGEKIWGEGPTAAPFGSGGSHDYVHGWVDPRIEQMSLTDANGDYDTVSMLDIDDSDLATDLTTDELWKWLAQFRSKELQAVVTELKSRYDNAIEYSI